MPPLPSGKTLLESCNLHTVLDLPGGTFTGAGVKTVVLFFEKDKPTQKIWFYQLNLDRSLGKTNPLNENDLAEFVELQKLALSGVEGTADSENSLSIDLQTQDLASNNYDLSVKNPNRKEEVALRSPQAILEEMIALDEESAGILKVIENLL